MSWQFSGEQDMKRLHDIVQRDTCQLDLRGLGRFSGERDSYVKPELI